MSTVQDFYRVIDAFAPFSTAESWDNPGILVGSGKLEVRKALFALDVTTAVVEEARSLRADLIVTHHPLIFHPIKKVSADDIAYQMIRSGISLLSAHTNLDIARGGVNDVLAETLGLKNIRPFGKLRDGSGRKIVVFVPLQQADQVYDAMAKAGAGALGNYSGCGFLARGEGRFFPHSGANPAVGKVGELEQVEEVRIEMLADPLKLPEILRAMIAAHPYEEPAYDILDNHAVNAPLSIGRMGEIEPQQPDAFAACVKRQLNATGVRYVPGEAPVQTVAVCGGSGADFLYEAAAVGAQALVTSECKHNLLLDAGKLGLTLVDAGHFSTENPVMQVLMNRMQQDLPGVEMHLSRTCTDKLKYISD